MINGNLINIIDVGGQQSQRRKWIHCFENVTSVIFIASLSSYNEVTYEDCKLNAMTDCLNLFDEIVNLEWFVNMPMILFLNKKDLFEQKIKKYPLNICFEEYDGEQTYQNGVKYIKEQFENIQINSSKPSQLDTIYSHVTCATDKNNVEKVFNDVQTFVINTALIDSGIFM